MDGTATKPLRIATIGTSMITRNLIEAMRGCEGAVFAGACSRSAERAAAFTRELGGRVSFSSVEELAESPEVDAVYIGSPNGLHAAQALACIRGGKHVLVEKPFAANEREARAVLDAAREAGVVALEAMRPLHDPAFHVVARALPRIGRVWRATLRFGKRSSRYDEVLAGQRSNVFDCALAGGALMDIGVYCVEPLVELFGEPAGLTCAPVLLPEETRPLTGGALDGAGVIVARYPGMVATVNYSKVTADLASSQFEGELGTVTVDSISSPAAARVDMRRGAVEAASAMGAAMVNEGASRGDRTMGGPHVAVKGAASGAAPASAKAPVKGYSGNDMVGEELPLPSCENSMGYELEDFVAAVRAVASAAGADVWEAPAGPFGAVGHFAEVTLASLRVMDEARRQAGISFPADRD